MFVWPVQGELGVYHLRKPRADHFLDITSFPKEQAELKEQRHTHGYIISPVCWR